MGDAKHTPGPWVVDGTKAFGAYGVWTEYATHPGHDGAGYPSLVCSVFPNHHSDFPRDRRDANARLIAASPDLLTACEVAGAFFDNKNGTLDLDATIEVFRRHGWDGRDPRGFVRGLLAAAVARAKEGS